MQKLILMCGLAGAGKSTYIKTNILKANKHAVVVSSDDIREELFGDASIQKDPSLVFSIARNRITKALKENKTVVFDATNLSRKHRRSILACAKSDVEKECHVVLATPEQANKNQQSRKRIVPYDVILHQMKQFNLPEKKEGFSNIFFYNPSYSPDLLKRLIWEMKDFDQTGSHHTETLSQHTKWVVDFLQKSNASTIVKEAGLFHDIGKLYTKTIAESDGEEKKLLESHFYQHANVSTYLYLCGKIPVGLPQKIDLNTMLNNITPKSINAIYYTALLIAHHDDIWQENWLTKNKDDYSDLFIKDLSLINNADERSSISREEMKEISLIDFINTFDNWEDIIKKEPLHINVKKDSGYILFKYNQFDTDMSYRIAKESRGSIVKQTEQGAYEYVCRPFDKFFNYGEEQASEIDWNSARVLEKVDGSLFKMWFDNDKWHLSTNGTIDAFKATIDNADILEPKSFGEIFERALGNNIGTFGEILDKKYTYMFEMTSPETQIVIPYEDGVYYLSARNTQSGLEDLEEPKLPNVKYPNRYHMNNLSEAIAIAEKLSKDEEGFVVSDKYMNRIKIKSPEYLLAAHLRLNGYVSDKRLIEYIQNEKIDDFLAYQPQYKDRVTNIEGNIKKIAEEWESDWLKAPKNDDKKEFAEYAKTLPSRSFLFEKYKNNERSAEEYILHMRTENIIAVIRNNGEKEQNCEIER